jgi:hypothetical protein
MISFFLLPSFSCFQMKPTSNGGKKRFQKKKRASAKERKGREALALSDRSSK